MGYASCGPSRTERSAVKPWRRSTQTAYRTAPPPVVALALLSSLLSGLAEASGPDYAIAKIGGADSGGVPLAWDELPGALYAQAGDENQGDPADAASPPPSAGEAQGEPAGQPEEHKVPGTGAGEKPKAQTAEDETIDIIIERAVEPKAARLDYEIILDAGYDSNPAGLPSSSIFGDNTTTVEPKGSPVFAETARVIYRIVGDQSAGLSIRGSLSLDQYPELSEFNDRFDTIGFNFYKTFNSKLRLTGDTTYNSIHLDGERIVETKSFFGELGWQHNPRHRTIFNFSISKRAFLTGGVDDIDFLAPELQGLEAEEFRDLLTSNQQSRLVDDELDQDGILFRTGLRHDINFQIAGKRAVAITDAGYGQDVTDGNSAQNQFVSVAEQFLFLFNSDWTMDASASYRRTFYDNPSVLTDFEQTRLDILRVYSAGLRWFATKHLNLRAGIVHLNGNSSIPEIYAFDRTVGTLTLEWRGEH